MVQRGNKRLEDGAAFPEMLLKLAGGGTLNIPEGVKGSWTTLLIYCGHWSPFCRQQLADFEERWGDFERRGVKLLAASVDSLEDAGKTAGDLSLSFPLAYGLDAKEFSEATGAFWEGGRNIIHATKFILNPEGEVASSVYSSKPSNRYKADDCLRLMDFLAK